MRGMQDFIIDDASGDPRFIDSRYGEEYPGARTDRRVVDPYRGSDRDSVLAWNLRDYLEQARNLADVRQVLTAYGNTYQPFVLSAPGIAAAVSAGSGPITRRAPGSWLVCTQLLIGWDAVTPLSSDFQIQVTRSAGPINLFDQPMHVGAFQESGFIGGTVYRLPRKFVLRPNEDVTFTVTNLSGALAASVHLGLAGYQVAVARSY